MDACPTNCHTHVLTVTPMDDSSELTGSLSDFSDSYENGTMDNGQQFTTSMCIPLCVCICMTMYVGMYVCVCVCMHVCMYVHTYVYKYVVVNYFITGWESELQDCTRYVFTTMAAPDVTADPQRVRMCLLITLYCKIPVQAYDVYVYTLYQLLVTA